MKLFHITTLGFLMSLPVFLLEHDVQAETMLPLPPAPKGCVYLKEVSTGETQIRKLAELGNENTDFAVPTSFRFSSYTAQFVPENDANYVGELYFKYNDGSNAKVYGKNYSATRFKRVSGTFRPPTVKQPYQVNFRVDTARNNTYQIAVLACQ
ncbi:MAG TPA: hypothetical protein IGS53_22075 [Leptolyngbyaceae cyanobacterium M33_DOE_097]|uniref:Uncharacterized protein n=1 Tax=Oscillatoriales cyanobacterium SpSt-418 TaxID=2282169 RepID=A0A7C3KGJ9_9CYAN|nr:hypothetical protein [Leptolyngbyaceae cyanobacterium M33_DOE_097]